ncbi:ImmA/IrrE family metallo-endopeptidase [Janibacter terrae]|uniref:ImmA/IrrE family metallo-endopeptidase n=1 Tax=Janibacter terrae TaxID=103817 RepID=UPI00146EB7F7|nr:ImmA/IrrE family metallo-endopeptidase [Janibacter terrae]
MHLPHPWRRLRDLHHVVVSWRDDLPEPLLGASEGDRIWLRSNLKQVERRCVLAHELEHHDRGHEGCQPEPVEAAVRAAAARWLLPDPHGLADALVWAHGDIEAAADELFVTPRVLRHRLDARHLHPAERAIIVRRINELEAGA